MRHREPPLKYLTVFDAVARHLSFKEAALELNVTPSAVSQQVHLLEDHIEEKLFHRFTRRIELTEFGEAYYAVCRQVLATYKQGYAALIDQFGVPVVRLSTITQIAYDILLPSLPAFQEEHPDIDLRIEVSGQVVDLAKENVNAGLRIGLGKWNGMTSLRVCDLQLGIVASPEFLRKHPIARPENLQGLPLIHYRPDFDDWNTYGSLLNVDLSENPQIYLDNAFASLSAAERGLGVSFAIFPLTKSRLDQGSLELVFTELFEGKEALYFSYPSHREFDASLQATFNWVEEVLSNG